MNKTNIWTSVKPTLYLIVSISMVTFSSVRLLNAQPTSARAFASGFYKWYVPLALQDRAEPTWHIALQEKKSEFDPLLVRLLKADKTAQDKCEDLVGLDFDPFLNSQDPAEHYEIGKVKQQGNSYEAEIYSVQAGQRNNKPDVIASFERRGNRWFFLNFYYSGGSDLVTLLKSSKLPCSSPRPVRR